MENLPLGAALIHANRRTDMTKVLGTFHNFVTALKKVVACSEVGCDLFNDTVNIGD